MNDLDLDRVRPVLWGDESWRDDTTGEDVARLRRDLIDAQREKTADAHHQDPPSILTGEVRKLTATVEAMRQQLPPMMVTTDVAADVLNVSVSTIRRMIKAGDLPYRRIGRSVRVDLSRVGGLDSDDISRLAREARSGR